MAKRTKNLAEQHASANRERIVADMARRASGAAGGHQDSGILPKAAAGRKTRMGSRSARRNAAVRDSL